MRCEVCGRSVGRLTPVIIEGSQMRACPECSKFGKVLVTKKKRVPRKRAPFQRLGEKQLDTVQGYGNAIRAVRESMGLTQKELGARIHEKTSVIARLEAEKMNPNKALAKKLEKALGIKILSSMEEPEAVKHAFDTRELTLGDVVKIKKK
jgi:putative transcription factor